MTDLLKLNGFRYSDLGEYSAEASDLGLPPGQWPSKFLTTVDQPKAKMYVAQYPVVTYDREGEDVVSVTYRAAGARFVIWND